MEKCVDNIVRKIAENLSQYDLVKKTVNNSNNLKGFMGDTYVWSKSALCDGLPGICLLFGKLMEVFPNEQKWEEVANEYMGYVVQEVNQTGGEDISMFSGLAGIGLATASISRGFSVYTNMQSAINQKIVDTLPQLFSRVCNKNGTHALAYDVIAGITGVLNYLYLFKKDQKCYELLNEGINTLIKLTEDIQIRGHNVPGWYIPKENQFSDIEKELYKSGCFNLGLAHGIAGPLVFLSEMLSAGICRERQKEAIQKIVDFYFEYRIIEEKRDIWKGQIEFDEIIKGVVGRKNIVRRDAWCYGNPGICYALVQAGIALHDKKIVDYAIQNLKATVHNIQGIYSPTFCHGYAGIYQIVNSVEKLLKTQELEKEKSLLKHKIMNFYEETFSYGFFNIEFDYSLGKFRSYETIGILDGAVGVCLSLFSAEHSENDIWKRAFLLV